MRAWVVVVTMLGCEGSSSAVDAGTDAAPITALSFVDEDNLAHQGVRDVSVSAAGDVAIVASTGVWLRLAGASTWTRCALAGNALSAAWRPDGGVVFVGRRYGAYAYLDRTCNSVLHEGTQIHTEGGNFAFHLEDVAWVGDGATASLAAVARSTDDHDGSAYVHSLGGLYWYDLQPLIIQSGPTQFPGAGRTIAIIPPQTYVVGIDQWVGSAGQHVGKLRLRVSPGVWLDLKRRDELDGLVPTDMVYPPGVGPEEGLYLYDNRPYAAPYLTFRGHKLALTGNDPGVLAVTVDALGNVWLGTDRGVFRSNESLTTEAP